MSRTTVPDDIARAALLPASYGDIQGTVFPALRWLRENAPVAKAKIDGYDPVWIVSTHAAVRDVLKDAELFHSADYNIMLQPQAGDAYLRDMLGGTTKVLHNLSYMEPPEHTGYRKATGSDFLPGKIRGYQPRMTEIAKRSVDDLLAKYPRACDIVEALTATYPLWVIMAMLGVEESDYHLMAKLTQDTFGGDDPDWRRDDVPATPEAMAKQWHAAAEDFYRYFRRIKDDRIANPREDLSTAIVTARMADGAYMPERIQVHLVMSIALAGHDTVNSAISAGIHGLALNPDQLQAVRKNPKLIAGLVEESLRWGSPAKHFMRNATRNSEVCGVPIATGDRLFCSLASANRDEAAFSNPDQFDITRKGNAHVTFSYGPHVCLGQHIAKMMMKTLFEEFIPRLSTIELEGPPRQKVSNFVSGYKSLKVRYTTV